MGFRAWFYFRMGWSTYFAFIFAAINTLTVTYYLAIENVEFLKNIFPSFVVYVLIFSLIGIPILTLVGWTHYRRTAAYGSEAEVQAESNPYHYKAIPGWQREVIFPLYLKLTEFMIKYSNNEKPSIEDINEIQNLKNKLDTLVKGGSIGAPRFLVDSRDKTREENFKE